MKLLVALAVMDRADRRGWSLADEIVVRRQDLSLFVQPLADLVSHQGYKTTVGDLVRRAIVDSDSAAADILIERLGGPPQVQAFLNRSGASGVRIDRDERHLQTEIVGLTWRPEYVDAAVLDKTIAAVPADERTAAYHRYQADPRDTATPRGMAGLLQRLATGALLSPASTRYVLEVMAQTATFPDRLKAGVPRGWALGHKTGTSSTWQGLTAATNDVGVLRAPDGGSVSVVVFIADSRAPSVSRAALMANIAAATTARYRRSHQHRERE
jgi:beta-lactamase class A